MSPAPIALFCYNRPDHIAVTLQSLANNPEAASTVVYAFCDGPKSADDEHAVQQVREVVRAHAPHFSKMIHFESETNKGLAASIITGVTEILRDHETVIVFEDDLRSHPKTLQYFNTCLEAYRSNTGVFSVSGYSFPEDLFSLPNAYPYDVYASARMQCWGWATWRDRWAKASFEIPEYDQFMQDDFATAAYRFWIGKDSFGTLERCMRQGLDVWACRWVYAHFKHNAVCLCPRQSYIDNIGLDGSGSNCGEEDARRTALDWDQPDHLKLPTHAFVDMDIHARFQQVFNPKR